MNKKLFLIIVGLFFINCAGVQSKSGIIGRNSLEQLEKKYKQLSKQYLKKVQNHPNDKELAINLARFYYNFRDYQKVQNLLRGLDSNEARLILAKALVQLKEYDQAIEIYQIIGDDLGNQEGLFLYGEVLEKKNLFPKAIEIYSKVKKPYRKQARERIESIQKKIENTVPESIQKLSESANHFLTKIEDEAAVVISVDETIEILPNKTSISTIHVVKKILKERGKDLAEIDIGYDSTYEQVELEYARTITNQSQVVYAGKENIRDVSRYLDFPLYSNSKAFIISMPAVGIGSYLEYKIKIYSSKLPAGDNFNFIYRLREQYPIFRANFKLIAPKGKKVNIRFFNQDQAKGVNLKPALKQTPKTKIYNWKFKELDPIVPEYNMPPFSYINPAFLVSSFSSWQEIYNWWFSLYSDKLKIKPEMGKLVKNLTKDKESQGEKAKAIYEYVAKNIRYVAVEYGDSGYEPHLASEVFINKYGDCKDQAILLVALLREAGLDAYPVLIPTRSSYPISKDFPSINFNHAIAAVYLKGNFIFMDPTSDTTPFGQLPLADQDRMVLLFSPKNYQILKTPLSRENQIDYQMDIDIKSSENANIKRRVWSKGYFASGYRSYLKYSHPSRIKEDISQRIAEIAPFYRILNLNIENENELDKKPVLTYEFIADNFLSPSGSLRILEPLNQLDFKTSLISKDERNFPIDFRGIFSKSAQVKVNLPSDIDVKYLPESRHFENKWFSLDTNYESRKQTINFSQKFSVKKRFVSKEEYQDFKNLFLKALYYLRGQIILEKKQGSLIKK
jgi:tetratricopeptide (TPR) repeat protein